jgi:glycosyltransferase involved in cell wall biosynthesis
MVPFTGPFSRRIIGGKVSKTQPFSPCTRIKLKNFLFNKRAGLDIVSSSMKILAVCNYQPPHMGGIEYAVEALKKCWLQNGHEVTWLTTDIPRRPELQKPDNVRIQAANIFETAWQINSPIPYPWTIPAIRRQIQSHDVINVHSLAPGLSTLTLSLALKMRKPVVATQHVGIIALKHAWMSSLQQHFICGMAEWGVRHGMKLTFVGKAVRAWFLEHTSIPAADVVMTPAGIDPQNYYFVPESERRAFMQKWKLSDSSLNVLFVGRFYEKKGLPLIREAATACPEMNFTLVGKGPINAAQWNLPNVRIIPYVETEELRELYGAHDLFIMPSFGEGWPAVVPQAMACGLSCLISPETFEGFNQDADRFIVCPRDLQTFVTELKKQQSRRAELLQRREDQSIYALKQWNWMNTARIYLSLFEERMRRVSAIRNS